MLRVLDWLVILLHSNPVCDQVFNIIFLYFRSTHATCSVSKIMHLYAFALLFLFNQCEMLVVDLG